MVVSDSLKTGKVIEVNGKMAKVDVNCTTDECQGCKASMFCGPKKGSVVIDVKIPDSEHVAPGDRVVVIGRIKGWFAGWLLLAGLPCIAILLGLAINYWWRLSEITAGCTCIGFLVIYYYGLYLGRKRLNKRVEWIVEQKIQS